MNTNVSSYIPFFGRDFLTATMGWTAEERGHYMVLLITQWEQGYIPDDPKRLELISPGLSESWGKLSTKFVLCDDGARRNKRLEEHRAKATELRQKRSEAGAKGNQTRWGDRASSGSQSDRNAIAKRLANGIAKASPPSPSPSPREEKNSSSSHHANEKEKGTTYPNFPCDKGTWVPTREMVEEWQATFPTIDVLAQLRLARQWCVDNVDRRKTPRGMRRFIGSWLTNAKSTPATKAGAKVLATL
jgi:uncharacterized protein YdaU (DUF1376 family)